ARAGPRTSRFPRQAEPSRFPRQGDRPAMTPPKTAPQRPEGTPEAVTEPPAPAAPLQKGLKAGTLGLLSSIVIAVSSTAPAYSMAATLGLVAAIAGTHTPGTLVFAFLPMLCIAVAFRELNKAEPDCGTTFAWARRA